SGFWSPRPAAMKTRIRTDLFAESAADCRRENRSAIEIKGEAADAIATATGGARDAAPPRRRSPPDARPRRARLAATGRQGGNPGTDQPGRRVPLAAFGGRAGCDR